MDYDIQPAEFSMLRKGGPENGHAADALVFQNGRLWGTGRTWQKVAFPQRFRGCAWDCAPTAARSKAR